MIIAIKPYKFLNREGLKVLAMVLMLLDHAYMTVVNVPGFDWMTRVGRLAFPIFAFQITEGFVHTSNRKRYTFLVFIFALISEIPYNLMMGGEIFGPFHQNVMFTFLIALLLLQLMDRLLASKLLMPFKILFTALICVLGVIVGTITFVDYSGFGVLTVLIFDIARRMPRTWMTIVVQVAGLWLINYVFLGGKVIIFANGWEFPEQAFALLSLPLIWCYNGEKVLYGRKAKIFKYVFYSFYPAHILVLSLIALYVL